MSHRFMELSQAKFNFEYDGEDFIIPHEKGQIRGCQWRPDNRPTTFVLIYVHDLGMFSTIKHDIIDFILDKNGAFVACDHLGHGRSVGQRTLCTVEEIVDETMKVISKTGEFFPDIPIFIWGTGIGALAIIQLVLRFTIITQRLRGVILESPYISEGAGRLSLFGSLGLYLANLYFPNYLFSLTSLNDPFSKSVSSEFTEKCKESPLYMPFITPRTLYSVLGSMTIARMRYMDWPADLPLLFLQGNKDPSVNPAESTSWVYDLDDSTTNESIECKQYDIDTSLLLKTELRPQVLSDMISFIQRHSQ